ncbi:hypothetical protein LPB136_12210 [Tenacibaculum todarodis]|uniref:Uncharacterized protein n=1 Tax=Tenacibaculum todarodis TaxID=1850252 RepID=A0A1L3JLP7_9FLAO|nr:hypothetical protein [Tenacibaculum todarodis]APG66086.1 hypothetical protein LPB136_12210 [Tenacibaculum todarodis]
MSFLINRYIKKKGYNSKWKLLSLTPFFIVGYFIYIGIYPSDEFYREDFKEVTTIELPRYSKIKYKTASIPDHFGDYTSVSTIEVSKYFYKKLPIILKSKGFKKDIKEISSRELDKAIKLSKDNNQVIISEYNLLEDSKSFYVGFLSDERTIIVQRLSW